jgi:hypothetical protein
VSPLRNSLVTGSSPPLQESELAPIERELFNADQHFVELTHFPTGALYQEPGGMDAVNALLRRQIGMALLNPLVCSSSVARTLCISGPPQCGLHNALLHFCEQQHCRVSVLRYRCVNPDKEKWAEFWHKVYKLAHNYQPCIVVVHRLLHTWQNSDVPNSVLAAMLTAWKRLDESKNNRPGEVWNLFIDDVNPATVFPAWTISDSAGHSAPSVEQKLAALRAALRIKVHEKTQDYALSARLVASYEATLAHCVASRPDITGAAGTHQTAEHELNFSGNNYVRKFIDLVFKASLDRQPQLAEHIVTAADMRACFPVADDFESAMRVAERSRVQESTMQMGSFVKPKHSLSAARPHGTAHPADDACVLSNILGQ